MNAHSHSRHSDACQLRHDHRADPSGIAQGAGHRPRGRRATVTRLAERLRDRARRLVPGGDCLGMARRLPSEPQAQTADDTIRAAYADHHRRVADLAFSDNRAGHRRDPTAMAGGRSSISHPWRNLPGPLRDGRRCRAFSLGQPESATCSLASSPPVIAIAYARAPRVNSDPVLWWNILGLTDLIVAVATGVSQFAISNSGHGVRSSERVDLNVPARAGSRLPRSAVDRAAYRVADQIAPRRRNRQEASRRRLQSSHM